MHVRALMGNCFRKNDKPEKARTTLISHAPTVAMLCEARFIGYIAGYERHSTNKNGISNEDALYVRNGVRISHVRNIQMSHDTTSFVAPARYAEVGTTEQDGFAYDWMATHMNADIKDHGVVKVHEVGTKEWVRHMKKICAYVDESFAKGHNPIIGMDSNFYLKARADTITRRQRMSLWWWAPQRALWRHGMVWHNVGMDGIAVPKRFRKHVGGKTKRVSNVHVKMTHIPAGEKTTGSDHPWIVLDISDN